MSTEMDRSDQFRKKKELLAQFNPCDRCLGRQFHNLFKGPNPSIGWAVRNAEKIEDVNELLSKEPRPNLFECYLCDGMFTNLDKNAKRVIELLANYDFDTFLIGVRIPKTLAAREKEVWQKVGDEYAEPLKKEIAREVGKKVEKETGKSFDPNPDIAVVLDFNYSPPKIELQIKSLFVYGEYQKLKRDIPQTRWLCPKCRGKGCRYCDFTGKLYRTSVEEEIGRPIIELTGGTDFKFHGSGREDKDVLNIGWRPFVIEILNPVVRRIDLDLVEERINKGELIKVKGLRFSSKEEVRELKSAKFDKTYLALVRCDWDEDMIKRIENAFNNVVINQRTPTRVSHRRADKIRKRRIYYVKITPVDNSHFRAEIKAESGTYIKELVSGDNGRTDPSFSSIAGKPCIVEELTVLEVHK